MTLKLDRLALVFVCGVAGVSIGCGGGGAKVYNDASVTFDTRPDAGDTSAPSDATPVSDGGAGEVAAPVSGDGSHLVVAGSAVSLVGSGNDSCTNQVPYSTDRWCAFAKPATQLGNTELWVINATQASAGATIKCNTTDANCLRLTSGLLDDKTFHFRIHRFDGDTLIFSEGASSSSSGDLFAWRPGWSAPRKLVSQTGELCIGSKTSATVLCVDNVTVDASKTKATLDIKAGTVADPNGGLLPLVDTVIYATMNDSQDDLQRYQWAISPDGRYIAWSGRYDVAGPETLKVQLVGDPTSRITVAEDVSAWSISDDLKKWFWLKTFNYNGLGAASGALESAPFPAGTPSKSLASKVGDYFAAGKSKGLLVRSGLVSGVGTLSLMPDRDAPGAIATLDTKVLNLFDVSSDGTKFMYGKTQEILGGVLPVFDLYIAKADGSPVCTLSSTASAFADPSAPKFLTSGGLAVFGRINGVTGEGEGLYVDVAMCKANKFATEIYAWQPMGDEGYVYSDELTAVNQNGETTLRFSKAKDGALPVGTLVQTRAALQFAPLWPALDSVMYTIGSGTAVDGLYINTKLPFTTTPPVAASDGGVPTTDASSTDVSSTTDAGATDTGTASDAGLDVAATSDGATANDAPDGASAETGGSIDADVDGATGG